MVIHILDSIYGRINGVSCSYDPPDYSSNPASVECHEKYGYKVVRDKCEGNRSCSIDVKPEQFSLDDDSCSHVPSKYLKVNYGCVSQKGNILNYFTLYFVGKFKAFCFIRSLFIWISNLKKILIKVLQKKTKVITAMKLRMGLLKVFIICFQNKPEFKIK